MSFDSSFPSFAGKTVLLTGATSGIGYAAALHFLQQNVGTLIITARSANKGAETRLRLIRESGAGEPRILVYALDLDSVESVTSFVETLKQERGRLLDSVVLNAGMINFSWEMTKDGNEKTLQTNYLSNVLLYILLLPLMREPTEEYVPHINIVGSQVHAKSPLLASKPLPTSILKYLNDPNAGSSKGFERYADSKLLVTLFVKRISALIDSSKVVINVLCPGAVKTNLAHNLPFLLRPLARLYQIITMSPRTADVASWELLFAVSEKAGSGTHGEFLLNSKVSMLPPNMTTKLATEMQKKLWEETVNWCNAIVPGSVNAVGLIKA